MSDLSKSRFKFLQSLKTKKFRDKHKLFIAEGEKIVNEIIQQNTFRIDCIYATQEWIENSPSLDKYSRKITCISELSLKKISNLKSPNKVLAILEYPVHKDQEPDEDNYNLMLDNIQDPGNLGAIIRIADWFNINKIYCSEHCVELFNPKVIQSSMASFLRVKVIKTDLNELLNKYNQMISYAATLEGEPIHSIKFPRQGFLIIGNEGAGITRELLQNTKKQLTIPKLGKAESLNAAVATGIILAQLKASMLE